METLKSSSSKALRVFLMTLGLTFFGGAFQEAVASHLVGGDLGYEYLGETVPGSGMYRYKLKMRMYLNCGPSSNWPQMQLWLGGAGNPLYCLLYTSPSPRDRTRYRMPSSA